MHYIKSYSLPFLLGAISFLIVVGFGPLNPQNIAWLDGGYDPSTHYVAWEFFRETPWTMPVGSNPGYGMEVGTSIVYSDSIPLMAILFKLFSGYLSSPFQYLGFWMLICFVMQGISGWVLLKLVTSNRTILFFSTLFFIYSPVFLWRLGEHAALLGQFLLIFGLYLNFCKLNHKRILYWMTLICSSLLIQIYFSPMLIALWGADLMSRFFIRMELNKSEAIKEVIAVISAGLIIAWGVGYFEQSGSSAFGLDYGHRQLNILSLFNPNGWSYILPSIPMGNPSFEGYSYLGLGVLTLIPIAMYFGIKKIEFLKIYLIKYAYLVTTLLFLTLFAISYNIAIGPFILHIPFPEFLIKIGGLFRASGRFFWPIYYMLLFAILALIIMANSRFVSICILSMASIVQVVDTSAGWVQKHKILNSTYGSNWNIVLKSPFWDGALKKYSSLIGVPLVRSTHDIPVDWSSFAIQAALNRMSTNFIYLGRYDESKLAAANKKYELAITSGHYDPTALYIIDDERVMPVLMQIDPEKDLFAKIDGYNVLAPGWVACSACIQPPKETVITKTYPKVYINQVFGFGKGQIGTAFLLGVDQRQIKGWGWAYPEQWGVWTEGSKAKVVLPIPSGKPKTLIMNFRAFITASHPKQSVEVFVNNAQNQTVTFLKEQGNQIIINLPQNDERGYIAIELRLPDSRSPKEIGVGDDIRPLGVGLIKAEFS